LAYFHKLNKEVMMSSLEPIKPAKKARLGLYTIGLHAYWDQFPGLRERLIAYGQFIERKLAAWAEVHNFGLVDTEETGHH
jgi:L-arabinose isomerase